MYAGATMSKRATGFGALVGTLVLGLAGAAGADEAATHYNMGLQLKRQGKSADAVAELEKAISLRSDYAAAYFTLGNLWRAQGDRTRRPPRSSGR